MKRILRCCDSTYGSPLLVQHTVLLLGVADLGAEVILLSSQFGKLNKSKMGVRTVEYFQRRCSAFNYIVSARQGYKQNAAHTVGLIRSSRRYDGMSKWALISYIFELTLAVVLSLLQDVVDEHLLSRLVLFEELSVLTEIEFVVLSLELIRLLESESASSRRHIELLLLFYLINY